MALLWVLCVSGVCGTLVGEWRMWQTCLCVRVAYVAHLFVCVAYVALLWVLCVSGVCGTLVGEWRMWNTCW